MNTSLYAVNTGLLVEADLNPSTVNGTNSAGVPRMTFQVKLAFREDPGGHWQGRVRWWSFGMLTGELLVASNKVADIRPIALNQWRSAEAKGTTDLYLNIEIVLDHQRITWIEQNRAGRSLDATLRIRLQVQMDQGVSEVAGEIPVTIADTKWREHILPGFGFGNVYIVELPAIGIDGCKALSHSFQALQKAQGQFARGAYDDAVGSCRIALDPFFEMVERDDATGKSIPRLKASWETRLGSATYQWLDSAMVAIKTVSNKPHHSPNNHFDRLGAQMLLMVTTALISYAAEQFTSAE